MRFSFQNFFFKAVRASRALLLPLIMTVAGMVAASAQITPYLESPRPDSIYVCWQTTSGTDSTVMFGATATSLTGTTTGAAANMLATNYYWHEVHLTGLSANTYYYYQAKTGSTTSSVFRFRTQPALGASPSDGHLRILVAGDNQIQSPTRWKSLLTAARTKIEALYGEPLEAAVNLLVDDGDQVDSGTIAEYQNTHFGMVSVVGSNIPVTTSIGNHEGYSDTSYTLYKAILIMVI